MNSLNHSLVAGSPGEKAVAPRSPAPTKAAHTRTAKVRAAHDPEGRVLFVVEQTAVVSGSTVELARQFFGVERELVYAETCRLRDGGVVSHEARLPFLREATRLRVEGEQVEFRLERAGRVRVAEQRVRGPIVLLSTLPWLAQANWDALGRGERLWAYFAVPKVLRCAPVTLRTVARTRTDFAGKTVAATPVNPLLRWLFGSTTVDLSADGRAWFGFSGLIEPRDLRRNGRWQEYLGCYRWADAFPTTNP
jgi:hypothetical protein